MLKKILSLLQITVSVLYSTLIYASNDSYINVLDVHGTFEENLFNCYQQSNDESAIKLKLLSIYTTYNLYSLTRNNIENNSQTSADVNQSESYQLRIFKNTVVDQQNAILTINNNAIHKSRFTVYYKVSVYNKLTNKTTVGMLPFFNSEIIDYNRPTPIMSMENFFEQASSIARHMQLLDNIDSQEILATSATGDDNYKKVINIPDDILLKNIYFSYNLNMQQLVEIMYGITKSLEFLHNNQIAHGDVKFNNVFKQNNKFVLSGFERFSVFNNKYSNLGIAKFTFNGRSGCHYAPEFKKKSTEEHDVYTNATFKGDIYSLGFLFTTIILLEVRESKFDDDMGLEDIAEYIVDEEYVAFNFLENPSFIKGVYPALYNRLHHLTSILWGNLAARLTDTPYLSLYKPEIPVSLIDLIRSCVDAEPANRPSATYVANELEKILSVLNRTSEDKVLLK